MNTLYNIRPDNNNIISLVSLVDSISFRKEKRLVMIEIGSYQGQSMEIFCKTDKIKTIVCIDPWKSGYDTRDPASYTDMIEVEKAFDKRVSEIKNVEIIKHKGTIDTFIKSDEFEKVKNLVDFVYIDGCHTYDACKHDIEICQNIIKPKIAISGHDYADYPNYWDGVRQAINEKIGIPDKTFVDGSWIKFI